MLWVGIIALCLEEPRAGQLKLSSETVAFSLCSEMWTEIVPFKSGFHRVL